MGRVTAQNDVSGTERVTPSTRKTRVVAFHIPEPSRVTNPHQALTPPGSRPVGVLPYVLMPRLGCTRLIHTSPLRGFLPQQAIQISGN